MVRIELECFWAWCQKGLLQYSFAVFFGMFVLRLLGVNKSITPLGVFIKRTVVLAMASTIRASATDLIESQKEKADS